MNWTQLILQLGISGAVLFVGYQLGLRVIAAWMASDSERNKAWTKTEADRTLAIAKAESERTSAIQAGFSADIAAHQAITVAVTALGNQFFRIEGKLDTVLDLTPVREQRAMLEELSEPKVVVEQRSRREKSERNTPPKGSPSTGREGK